MNRIVNFIFLLFTITHCFGQQELIFQEMEEPLPKYSYGDTLLIDKTLFRFVKEKGDLLILENSNEKGVFDADLKPIIRLNGLKNIKIQEYGLHLITNENKHGLYDFNGIELIPAKMKYLSYLFEGVILTTNHANMKGLYFIQEKLFSKKEFCDINGFESNTKKVIASLDCNNYGITNIYSIDSITNFEITDPQYIYFNRTSAWILKKNEMTGVVRSNQEQILPFEYHEVYNLRDYFIVNKEDKWGVVDQNNQELVSINYESIKSVNNKDLFKVSKNNTYGVVDITNNISIPIVYDDIKYNYQRNEYEVIKEGKRGIVSENGKIIIPLDYDILENNWEDAYIVSNNEEFGVISYVGKEIIPQEYNQINNLSRNREFDIRGYHVLNSSLKSSFFDHNGIQKTEFIFDEYEIHGSQQPIKVKVNDSLFYVNAHGECVEECPEDSLLNKYGLKKSTVSNNR